MNMDIIIVKRNDVFKITGNWNAQSKQLKSQYPQLTDSDLKLKAVKRMNSLVDWKADKAKKAKR